MSNSAILYPPSRKFPKNRSIKIVPGKTLIPYQEDFDLPKIALVSWQKIGPNEYRPVVRIHERWVRLTKDLPEKLGMGIDYKTLMRLIRGGFISSRRPGPNTTVIDIESWFTHLEKTSDPEYWSRRNNSSTKLTNFEHYASTL